MSTAVHGLRRIVDKIRSQISSFARDFAGSTALLSGSTLFLLEQMILACGRYAAISRSFRSQTAVTQLSLPGRSRVFNWT
jgi:hypothetical protein